MNHNQYSPPLDGEKRRKIRQLMGSSESLAEITREVGQSKVINYLVTDKSSLELYLTEMAGKFTKQRKQISCNAFIASIFHAQGMLSYYNQEFISMFKGAIDKECEIQQRIFIAENHLQVDIHSDMWKMYKRRGDTVCLDALNFSVILQPSLRYELKYYFRHIFNCGGKIKDMFTPIVTALNALTNVNPQIKYFADISEVDARAMLMFLENTYKKENGDTLSKFYIALSVTSIRKAIDYLMSDMRDTEIKAPRPHMNPFADFSFHRRNRYRKSTSMIPEEVIEKLNKHSDELPPIFKLLYDIFINTGLRLKEVFFLETDCIEESRYDGVCQLKFTPHKVLAARRRHGAGDYHRIMIPKLLADKISNHINEILHARETNGSSYIFLSQRPCYSNTVMDSRTFTDRIRVIIEKHDIRDENDELWHLTVRQFRKTIAVTLIENGATTAELAYWLGHMCSDTATEYYVEVREMKLAELNTKFFKKKFDLVLSSEQLEEYTEEERRLLYIDFRLEQRRVELGYCLRKAPVGHCPNRNSLYNCVNCKNLCTGEKYLPYWNELLAQQKDIFELLLLTYQTNGIENYIDFAEYKQELRLFEGYESIVKAIKEGGHVA